MSTAIRWTNETWNPATGCSKVSAGCRHCYAEQISLRFRHSSRPWAARFAEENLVLHPDRLAKPFSWRTPKRVFVNSMSDLFHELVPDEYIARVFEVMVQLPQHTFQVLTKRSQRAAEWPGPWPENIWMGVSVEHKRVLGRVDDLRRCGAATKFLSAEPLLGPLCGLSLDGIDWVIVGGESGPHHRPMEHDWARAIRDLCVDAGKAFFFKQDSATRSETRPWLDGMIWEQYPGDLVPPRPAETSPPDRKG